MKIYVLDQHGHTTLTCERDALQIEMDKLSKEGKYLVDGEGRKFEKVEEVPDTVDELIAGKLVEDRMRGD